MTRSATVTDLIARVTGDAKHAASAHSTRDVIEVLYRDILDVSPARLDDPDRDRCYLSKGHGPAAYYAVLADHGYFPAEWLDTMGTFDSPLGHHPDRTLIPGVEISSGSLGQGLPIAVGSALGLRIQGRRARVVVLVGDAELDEGSNAEAIEFAAAVKLGNLTAVVIDNHSSSYAVRGRIAARFAVNGWQARTVDGRDHDALREALTITDPTTPTVVVATIEEQA